MLTPADDYPLHQTPEPIAFAGTDRNFYDRFFFNAMDEEAGFFVAVALGVYPQLDIMDASVAVVLGEKQYNLHASKHMLGDRLDLSVGPIHIEIEKPLERITIRIAENEGPISGRMTMTARHFPVEEPRFIRRVGTRAFMDYTRMTQNGHFTGWISLDGMREDMVEGTCGTRDRSWGVRPIGARDPQPMPGTPMPAFFWQWTPINFEGGSLFFHVNNDQHGESWNTRAAWAADGADADQINEGAGSMRTRLEGGTRWPSGGTLSLALPGAPEQVTFEPIGRFHMKGLGYTHPEWGHGMHHGPLRVERDDFDLASLDPLQPENLHVQMIVQALTPDDNGIGAFEQLIIGPFSPLGLDGFIDPAKG